MRPWTLSQTVEPNAGFVFVLWVPLVVVVILATRAKNWYPVKTSAPTSDWGAVEHSPSGCTRLRHLFGFPGMPQNEISTRRAVEGKVPWMERWADLLLLPLSLSLCCLYFITPCKFCRCVERKLTACSCRLTRRIGMICTGWPGVMRWETLLRFS